MIPRRQFLQGASLGTSGMLFAPLLKTFAAQQNGTYKIPRRVVFVLFDNGFQESGCQPFGASLESEKVRQLPLASLTLPHDIQPLDPYKDRLAIVQGLQARHLVTNHGAGYGALSGVNGGAGRDRFSRVVAESIDAAVAGAMPGVFPLLLLGVDPGNPSTTTVYCSSAWGRSKPISVQCRPELAFESLFGSIGASRNDFLTRRNLLDFVADDVKRLRTHLDGSEREQLDTHLMALESLSQREGRLGQMQQEGQLKKSAPKPPSPAPQLMTDVMAAQFDIAASALMSGLTNVVTITSGLCRITGKYTGISNLGTHSVGHNEKDSELNLMGYQILSKYRRYVSEQIAGFLKKLREMPEGDGNMLDNTLLVFTSDSANRQHTGGENWPFVLVGNLGGRIKTGQLVTYPMSANGARDVRWIGSARKTNPTINALYCTILHAIGAPREHFNLVGDAPAEQYAPLKELQA